MNASLASLPIPKYYSEEAEGARSSRLVIELARMLHTSGTPAHELEERMQNVSRILGAPAKFFSTPTSLFVSFDCFERNTALIRVTPGSVNLAKLSQLHELQSQIENDELPPAKVWSQLQAIERMPPRYGAVTTLASFCLIGGGAAVFFGGHAMEILFSGLISLMVGLVVQFCSTRSQTQHLIDLAAAFLTTVLVHLAGWVAPTLSLDVTMISSLIILLPGLGITVAINELATQNLASGTARMAGAMTTFISMGFGVVMGRGLMLWLLTEPAEVALSPLPWEWIAGATIVCSFAFVVLFQAQAKDLVWILLAAMISYGGARLGGVVFGSEAAAWTGSFLLGIASNLFARYLDRPAAVMQVPGMILLVPGSVGFVSLFALLDHDIQNGIGTAFSMALVAVSIVAGLLMANALVPTRRGYRKAVTLAKQKSGSDEAASDQRT
ncbi:MAG: threonine/serine exporter family protein [Pirellulales bacterium]|nr:threonine/serine exporter family protein [Pirellulales bacterium]